jgi:hypothetical protein
MSLFLTENTTIVGKGYFHGKLYNIGDYPGAILSISISNIVYGSILLLKCNLNLVQILDDNEEVGKDYSIPNRIAAEK